MDDGIAPVWVGEFSTDTRPLANFGLSAVTQPREARNAAWWRNIYAWLTAADVDWCWWGLNPTHARARTRRPGGCTSTGASRRPTGC